MRDDFHNLARFTLAQEPLYSAVLSQLHSGKKRSHWMWFIFPQLEGLGRSATAQHYAIKSLDEARAYLAHPLLGERLRECVTVLLGLEGCSAEDIFGYPDVLKLHSSLTLFDRVSGDDIFDPCPGQILRRRAGRGDTATHPTKCHSPQRRATAALNRRCRMGRV